MSTSVRFVGRKEPVFVDEGSTILDAVSGGGFSIPADCGGLGKCGRCRVKVVEGAPALTPSKAETARIGAEDIESGIRLACCHEVTDGLLIEIVEEIYRKEGYKRLGVGIGEPLPLGPAFRSTPLGDGNLEEAFDEAGLTGKDWAALFPDVSEADDGRNAGTPEPPRRVALTSPSGRVFALKREPLSLYGVAVDLGTTTVAAYLCDFQTGQILDVQTARNPQVTFGADVMSRILASQKPKDARALKQLACETISSCIQMLCKENGIAREDLVETILVGNPTMVHLLIGAPARGLGIAPYRPLFHGALELKARDFGLPLHPGASFHTLPLPSAFVGADTMAAWLWAERFLEDGSSTLLLDLGTNGEMVLSANGRLWATACATGPAFEGATLACGLQGVPGAIERVRFDEDGALVLNVIGSSPEHILAPKGICGSGAMSVLAALLKEEIIRPDGRFDPECDSRLLRKSEAGVELLLYSPSDESLLAGERPVTLHQKDIRELQFAKGAVATGIRFLCEAAEISVPDRILLAGAFGNVIQPEDAVSIGLIPEISTDRIMGIGNAAGLGACMALLDSRIRERAKKLLGEIQVIELGGAPGFKEAFFDSLRFPAPAAGKTACKTI